MSSAVSLLKGETKTMRRKEKRARIEQIRVILGLSDSQRTPVVMLYLSLVHFAKSVVFGYCSTFVFFLTNIVQSRTN